MCLGVSICLCFDTSQHVGIYSEGSKHFCLIYDWDLIPSKE